MERNEREQMLDKMPNENPTICEKKPIINLNI